MSSPQLWSAGRYDVVGDRIAHIATDVLDEVERRRPLRDCALIDLACGTGSAALSAVARGARVTGVDITPELTALGAQKDGGTAVTWVAADASDTGLAGGSFDAAVSNMGTVFVEPAAQVAEIARLLTSGGTVAFSAWVHADDNPLFDPIVAVLGAPPSRGFTPDQWGDPDIAAARLAADFDDVTSRPGLHTWEFASHTEAMAFIDESPLHLAVLSQTQGRQRADLITAFGDAMRAHTDDHGRVSFDSPYAVVAATRR